MLTLPIKKEWFDLVVQGKKKQEYRDITPYWRTRFENVFGRGLENGDKPQSIRIKNGYAADAPSAIITATIDVSTGQPKWGAEPGQLYYVLTIHKVKPDKSKRSK